LKLLCITLTQSCNYNCPYCTMKEWTYPIGMKMPLMSSGEEKPVNCITNERLLAWLDGYIPPGEWFIKITGGEPGLYPEIETLIPALEQRGYRGYVETNGSLPIPKSDNFPRLAAWHTGRPKPEYFDVMLILQDPADDWAAKVRHCEENGIPFYSVVLRGERSGVPEEEIRAADEAAEPSGFDGLLMMYSQGQLMTCPAYHYNYGDIWQPAAPSPQPLENGDCSRCAQVLMADIFFRKIPADNK